MTRKVQKFSYDPLTGIFTRDGEVIRPSFDRDGNPKLSFYLNGKHIRQMAARVAWAMHYKTAPTSREYVVFASGDKSDLRIANLRKVPCSHVRYRQKANRTNTSGYRGVVWASGRKKWLAAIHTRGTTRHIGYFDCPEQASRAYNKVRMQMLHE